MNAAIVKSTFVCACVTVALSAPVYRGVSFAKGAPQAATTAQEQTPREKFQTVVESLDLTDDQKTKLKPMFEEAKTKAQAVMDNSSLSDDEKKAQMREVFANLRKNVNTVLTPDQQAKLKAKMEEAKAKRDM